MSFHYEGLSSLGSMGLVNEKHTTVVFDFGYAYTKLGFAGEASPRAIVKSEVKCRNSNEFKPVFKYDTVEQLTQQLVDFIHILYFKKLLVNAKERRVVVVENILGSSVKKTTLASVLFKFYEVFSILFVPSHLISLMTLAVNTGLVLDIGYEEATIIPVYEGVPILNAWQSVTCGGKAVESSLCELLMDRAMFIDEGGKEERLSSARKDLPQNILEDIKVRCCLASTLARSKKLQSNKYDRSVEPPPPPPAVRYPLMGNSVLIVPGTVREMAPEALFERDQDNLSLPAMVLQAIMKCPIDIRRTLANNLVIIGGTANMRGLKGRLLAEIRELASQPTFCRSSKIDSFKVHEAPAKDNCVAWLGGAIIGCTEAALLRPITKETFLATGFVPDWSNLAFNTKEEEASRTVG